MYYRQVEREYSHLFLHHFTVPAVVSKTESGKCFIKVEPGHPWGLQSALYPCVCVCVCSHTYIYIYKYVFLPPSSSNLSHARFLFLKMYLFFASLALCCGQAFCSCDEWGLLFIAVRRLLTAVTSHVEHRL